VVAAVQVAALVLTAVLMEETLPAAQRRRAARARGGAGGCGQQAVQAGASRGEAPAWRTWLGKLRGGQQQGSWAAGEGEEEAWGLLRGASSGAVSFLASSSFSGSSAPSQLAGCPCSMGVQLPPAAAAPHDSVSEHASSRQLRKLAPPAAGAEAGDQLPPPPGSWAEAVLAKAGGARPPGKQQLREGPDQGAAALQLPDRLASSSSVGGAPGAWCELAIRRHSSAGSSSSIARGDSGPLIKSYRPQQDAGVQGWEGARAGVETPRAQAALQQPHILQEGQGQQPQQLQQQHQLKLSTDLQQHQQQPQQQAQEGAGSHADEDAEADADEQLPAWWRDPQVVLAVLSYGAVCCIYCALDELLPTWASAPVAEGGGPGRGGVG
jgi:hypothetical protein